MCIIASQATTLAMLAYGPEEQLWYFVSMRDYKLPIPLPSRGRINVPFPTALLYAIVN